MSFFKIAAIIVVAWIFLRVLKRVIKKLVKSVIGKTYKIKGDIALKKRTETLEKVFYSTIKVLILIVAVLMILAELNINIGPILAAMGVVGLAFGFGAQYLIRDLITGFFIILEDQYRKGDVISISGVSGTVEDLNLRKTVIRDMDGVEHHIPNGEIKITSNKTKLWSKINLNIGVSYDSDIDVAIETLNEIGAEMAKSKKWKDIVTEAPQALGINEFADSAVIIKVSGQTKPGEQWSVARELRRRIKIAFDKKGIEIPFPHQVIVQK